MTYKNNGSIVTRISSFLFFIVLTIASLSWFFASAYSTLHSVSYNDETVYFSKGAMYALGAGIILLLLTLLGSYQNIKKVELSATQSKWATRTFIFAAVFMFVFPIAAHFMVNKLISKSGYVECKELSYQWLLYKNLVYTNNESTCALLIQEKQLTKYSRNL